MISSKHLKTALRALFWLAPSVLTILSFAIFSCIDENTALVRARILLVGGDYEAAHEALSGLADSLWVGESAGAGLTVCEILLTEETPTGVVDLDLEPFAPRLLMMRDLRSGEYRRCLRLASLARASGLAWANLYEAAALAESGKLEDAYTLWAGFPEIRKSTFLGRRLAEALELRNDNISVIVRDRNGEFVGTLDSSVAFSDVRGLVPLLLPRAVLSELAPADGAAGLRISTDLDLSIMVYQILDLIYNIVPDSAFHVSYFYISENMMGKIKVFGEV